MPRISSSIQLLALLLLGFFSPNHSQAQAAADPNAPSFNCKYAKSAAEKLICASPELAALDRQLSETFRSLVNQGGIDARALRAEERKWVHDARDACSNAACVKRAYQARNQQLLDSSRRVASPAADEETRPFPVDPALWTEVRAFVGKRCSLNPAKDLPGLEVRKDFFPVVARNAVVYPRGKHGTWFAFLMTTKNDNGSDCRIADVVTLPPSTQANAFLQCSISDLSSYGFGMRFAGRQRVVGYWEIDAANGKLIRQPLGVLGAEKSIRCQPPESGD